MSTARWKAENVGHLNMRSKKQPDKDNLGTVHGRGFVGATFRTALVLAVRVVVQAGTLLFLGHALGAELFGKYSSFAALAVLFGAVTPLGFSGLLLKRLARDRAERMELLTEAIPMVIAAGLAMLCAYMIVVSSWFGHLGVGLQIVAALGAAEIVFQPPLQLVSAELQADNRVAASQAVITSPLILKLGAAALSLWAHYPPLAFFSILYCCASALALIAGTLVVRQWPGPATWRPPRIQTMSEAGGYCALSVSTLAMTEIDKAVAGICLPVTVLGLYALSTRIVGALVQPVIAMMLVMIPRVLAGGYGDTKATLRKSAFLALVYALVGSGCLLFGAPVIELIFGHKFIGLTHVLRWSAILLPGMALRLTVMNFLVAHAKPWWRVICEAGAIALFIIFAVLLAPFYGYRSVILTMASAELFAAAVGWFFVVRAAER